MIVFNIKPNGHIVSSVLKNSPIPIPGITSLTINFIGRILKKLDCSYTLHIKSNSKMFIIIVAKIGAKLNNTRFLVFAKANNNPKLHANIIKPVFTISFCRSADVSKTPKLNDCNSIISK